VAAVAGGALATVVVAGLLRSWRASDLSPPINLPPGFTADVFAAGLGPPRSLAVDPAGTLIVSIPSQGKVIALADRGAGRAVETVTVAEGLDLPHGLAFRHGDLYVAETGRILRFRYDATTLAARDPAVVVANLPAGAHHWTRGIAFSPDGALYVSVGSSCDICREADSHRASIVRYEADSSGERLFATGLRNPVGLAFHPRSGVLWTTVNERDWRRGGAPPDYVTEVYQGRAYGWPDCYAERGKFVGDPELQDRRDCQGLTPPTFEVPPHSAPLGLAFYSGTAFPSPYRESLFVAGRGCPPPATSWSGSSSGATGRSTSRTSRRAGAATTACGDVQSTSSAAATARCTSPMITEAGSSASHSERAERSARAFTLRRPRPASAIS